MLNTPTIDNQLTEGCKVSQIMPFLKIIAQQQKLNLTRFHITERQKEYY